MSIIDLQTRLQQALQQPELTYADIDTFRGMMSATFQSSTLPLSAFYLGAQSATPGMAFLSGYQSALRCLNPLCSTDQFAAFCVSEKGIKKPWDMETHLKKSESGFLLNGCKGFVMLLPNTIDRLYVVAKCEDGSLSCIQLAADVEGLSVAESLNAPFIQDIPHAGIVFKNVVISTANVLSTDAHQQANKPFRYWEDVHVAIAMAGWMLRQSVQNLDFEADKVVMLRLLQQLIESFEKHPNYYSLASLDLLDECHQRLDDISEYLPESILKIWQKDRLLLQMGFKIRQQIRVKHFQ